LENRILYIFFLFGLFYDFDNESYLEIYLFIDVVVPTWVYNWS